MITDPWPLVRGSQIHVKNPKHPVAILTCWTKKDSVIKQLEDAGVDYNSVGQLYTTRGVSPLIRNLLANRHIKDVIITGRDLSHVGADLHRWRAYKVTDIPGCDDIPPKVLVMLYRDVRFDIVDISNIVNIVTILGDSERTCEGKLLFSYPEPDIKTTVYPSADFGHMVTGRTIPETYLKMLQYILRFGKETDTHYGDPQKEVLAMQNIITEHPPLWCHQEDGFYRDEVPEWMPEDTQHVETYIRERILNGKCWPDLKYTYGELIHAFSRSEITHESPLTLDRATVDQFDLAVKKMVDDPNQRSCVISLWDPLKHTSQKSGTPCLSHLQFRMRDDVLTLHALIRSNDMFSGWNNNAYALRVLQEEFIFRYLNEKSDGAVTMGPLCITSVSAHLYRDTWEPAQELVDKYLWEYAKRPQADWDPKGQFEISRDGDELVVILTDGKVALEEWRAGHAKNMCNMVCRDVAIGSISNGMYLGRELMRLEMEGEL